eukprot:1421752-Amphidinium_carterae.1
MEGAFADATDDGFTGAVEGTLVRAKLIRIQACLMQLYVQQMAPTEIRPKVQREVKALRVLGLREKDCLPVSLLGKVQATLAMKL